MPQLSSGDLLAELPLTLRTQVEVCGKAGLDLLPWITPRGEMPQIPILEDFDEWRNRCNWPENKGAIKFLIEGCELFDRTDLTRGAVEFFVWRRVPKTSLPMGWPMKKGRPLEKLWAHDRRVIAEFAEWLVQTGRLAENPVTEEWPLLLDVKGFQDGLAAECEGRNSRSSIIIASRVRVAIKKCGFRTCEEFGVAAPLLHSPKKNDRPSPQLRNDLGSLRRFLRYLQAAGRVEKGESGQVSPKAEGGENPLFDDLEEYRLDGENQNSRGRSRRRGQGLPKNVQRYRDEELSAVRKMIEDCGFQSGSAMSRPVIFLWFHLQGKSRSSTLQLIGFIRRFTAWLLGRGKTADQALADLYPFSKKRDKPWYERTSLQNWEWLDQYEALGRDTHHDVGAILTHSNLPAASVENRRRAKTRINDGLRLVRRLRRECLGRDRWVEGSYELMVALRRFWAEAGLGHAEIRDRWNGLPLRIRVAIAGGGQKHYQKVPLGVRGRKRIAHQVKNDNGTMGDLLSKQVWKLKKLGKTRLGIRRALEGSREGPASLTAIDRILAGAKPKSFGRKAKAKNLDELQRELRDYRKSPRAGRNEVWRKWAEEKRDELGPEVKQSEVYYAVAQQHDELGPEGRERLWAGHPECLADGDGRRDRSKRDVILVVADGICRDKWAEKTERLLAETAGRDGAEGGRAAEASPVNGSQQGRTRETVGEDGPCFPHSFRWRGEEKELRIQPQPFKLLVYVWQERLKGNSVLDIRQVAKAVWGSPAKSYDAMKPSVFKMNQALLDAGTPFCLEKSGNHLTFCGA